MDLTHFFKHYKAIITGHRLPSDSSVCNYLPPDSGWYRVIIILMWVRSFIRQGATLPECATSTPVGKHPPSRRCRCAAPPSPSRRSLCWSSSRPGRTPPAWSGGSSSAAPWWTSGRAGAAPRLPAGTRQPPLLLGLSPPEWASLLQLASQARPGPRAAPSHSHGWVHKQNGSCRGRISPKKTNKPWGTRGASGVSDADLCVIHAQV